MAAAAAAAATRSFKAEVDAAVGEAEGKVALVAVDEGETRWDRGVAVLRVRTVEGHDVRVEARRGVGFALSPSTTKDDEDDAWFETMQALLSSVSPGYRDAFARDVEARLAQRLAAPRSS